MFVGIRDGRIFKRRPVGSTLLDKTTHRPLTWMIGLVTSQCPNKDPRGFKKIEEIAAPPPSCFAEGKITIRDLPLTYLLGKAAFGFESQREVELEVPA
ncbi:unnamed protein product [Caretta caretta]